MAQQDPRTLPKYGPQECRARAEEMLAVEAKSSTGPPALVWALLAIAGELHEIRTAIKKR
ncbi:hypothetical protein [Streptomyces sp. NPDC018693]|uniref:hypothetical protein n=1 Tax=unclassified Streptomyces TaxID=2593676 RepID=UPI003797421A